MKKLLHRRRCGPRHRRFDRGLCPAPSVVSRPHADEQRGQGGLYRCADCSRQGGLKLTPDQEKLWPPVETAVRDFAKLRIDRANARMNAQRDDSQDAQKPDDPVTRLRERAETMATTAAAMKRIADAADPLYKTLDDSQKRRLAILTHMERPVRRRRLAAPWLQRGMMDRGDDRGYDRDRGYRDGGPGRDRGDRGGPERL